MGVQFAISNGLVREGLPERAALEQRSEAGEGVTVDFQQRDKQQVPRVAAC